MHVEPPPAPGPRIDPARFAAAGLCALFGAAFGAMLAEGGAGLEAGFAGVAAAVFGLLTAAPRSVWYSPLGAVPAADAPAPSPAAGRRNAAVYGGGGGGCGGGGGSGGGGSGGGCGGGGC